MKFLLCLLLSLPLWVSAEEPLKMVDMDMGICRVRLQLPNRAVVNSEGPGMGELGSGGIGIAKPPRAQTLPYEDELVLGFGCYENLISELTDGYPVRFDALQGKWVKDMDRFFDKQVWRDELTPKDRKQYTDAVRVFEIRTRTALGFAFTQDDLIGDERGRRRQMRYCIFHVKKALCGESTMALLPLIHRNRKNDLTPYALRILRSIEFLPDVAVPADTPASDTVPTVR
jgi:hypothetical protein